MIHVLDDETINKIAAGEVVERPLNVVKELVENSIDAGATAITVEIKGGGIDYIRVTDNGKGIPAGEVKTAFLRHATSKISSEADLNYLHSLGFRGEALASVAAVSQMEMITKTEDQITGTRIYIEGGEVKEFDEVGAPNGTTTVVRNLFYNVPPRKKFLHSAQTEGAAIVETMQHLALSAPGLSFKVVVNGSLRFMTNGNGDLKEVIYRIYGKSTSDELIPIMVESGGIKIEGYLGRPVIARSNRSDETYYINSRYVKSQGISKGIEEGYKAFLMMHRFPFCVLHLNMDTTTLDVNIHPNKMQVRMDNQEFITNLLSESVHDALLERNLIPDVALVEESNDAPVVKKAPEPFEQNRIQRENDLNSGSETEESSTNHASDSFNISGRTTEYAQTGKADSATSKTSESSGSGLDTAASSSVIQSEDDDFRPTKQVFFDDNEEDKDVKENAKENAREIVTEDEKNDVTVSETEEETVEKPINPANPAMSNVKVANPNQYTLFENEFFTKEAKEEYKVIGQVFDTYWIIALKDKFYFMDQHAAHEKVKYEEFMAKFKAGNLESQNLLPPYVITLKPSQYVIFDKNRDAFANLSFEIDDFGTDAIAIRAVPSDLFGYSIGEMFADIMEELATTYSAKSLTTVEERIATRACKSAIKGNTVLTPESAQKLVNMLFTLENPYQCPHGRPTLVAISKYELEKMFKRIV